MTRDQLICGKVVIFSHYATTGACEELRDWLRSVGARDVVYVAFPFGSCKDRFIRVERCRGGGTVEVHRSLFRLRLPEPLAYAKDFAYAVWYAFRYAAHADVLVAGDNLLTLAAVVARKMARIRSVVYYMIDYSPVRYANRLLNELYYFVDRLAAYRASAVWPLTVPIIKGRFDSGRLNEGRVRWYEVPYGCHPVDEAASFAGDVANIVYMGDIVRSKGAELFVPFAIELKRRLPRFTFTVIGGGRDLAAVRADVEAAGLRSCVDLCGFIGSIQEVIAKLVTGSVAIAPYYPFDANSFTFYSDPGKIKVYLGCGLPIVLTDVPPIAKRIEKEGAGRIAAYDAADMADKVVEVIRSPDYARYRSQAMALGRQYRWETLFVDAFARLNGEPSSRRGRFEHV